MSDHPISKNDEVERTRSSDEAAPTPAADESPCAQKENVVEPRDIEELKQDVVAVLQTVYDPEIPVNIQELGMIYDVTVSPEQDVLIQMTLTSPACPVAGSLPGEVETKVAGVQGVRQAKVELVWDPPWTPDMMSEAAKLRLNMF